MQWLLILIYIFTFVCVYSRLTKANCKSYKCLFGQTAIVTGGNKGIGYETVLNLASRGCKIIIASSTNATNTVNNIIKETGNNRIYCKHLDLGSLASVRQFSQDILMSEERLDILINNAGCSCFEGIYTSDQLLKLMQINYFGHFLLTHLLVELLKKSNGRIVFVSSFAAFFNRISRAEDINKPSDWLLSPSFLSYGNSKLCMIIASNIFAKKLKKYGIKVIALHPGIVTTGIFHSAIKHTNSIPANIISYFGFLVANIFGKTTKEGCQMNLHCSLSDEVESGGFYVSSINFIQPSAARNSKLSNEIWKLSEELVHLKPEEKLTFIN